MSDGNFNRALLPSTPYRSGWKAGERIAKQNALEALKIVLSEQFPSMSQEEKSKIISRFLALQR